MTTIGNIASQLVTIAILVEAVTEVIKLSIPKELTTQAKQVISIAVGIVIAIAMQVSLFQGSTSVNALGMILAGVIASRGSNYTHDLIGVFEKLGDVLKQKAS